jgi:hypothetical protein
MSETTASEKYRAAHREWELQLSKSWGPVMVASHILLLYGYKVELVEHEEDGDDPGDLIITRHNFVQRVDPKRAFRWVEDEPAFPFRHVFMTREENYHDDWWYWIFNVPMTYMAFCRPSIAPKSALIRKETRTTYGAKQISVGLSVNHVRIYSLLDLKHGGIFTYGRHEDGTRNQ